MDKKQLLKESIDIKSYRSSIIMWSAILILCILMLFLPGDNASLIVFDIIFIPICIYFIFIFGSGIYELTRDPHKYVYLYGTPVASHTSEGSSKYPRVYFVLSVNDGTEEFEIETNDVFSAQNGSKNYFGDLFGRKFLVLYDKSGSRCVVAKVMPKEDE